MLKAPVRGQGLALLAIADLQIFLLDSSEVT
jgi:hypothetical protein